MAQLKCLLLLVFLVIISQCLVVAFERVTPIAATADPCTLGAILAVHYKSFGDDCGETVDLNLVYSDGKPGDVSFSAADESKLYTLMMVDPDVPDAANPTDAYFLHWLIINIQGSDLRAGNYGNGNELMNYFDPLPDEGSGLHRYQFFVFAQAGNLDISSVNGRTLFDVAAFMAANSLTGPIAGYQYRTEETGIFPTTHAALTHQESVDSTPQSSTGSTPQSSTDSILQNSTNATSSQSLGDEATATTPAGAVILKGNWVVLVTLALLAVYQFAQ